MSPTRSWRTYTHGSIRQCMPDGAPSEAEIDDLFGTLDLTIDDAEMCLRNANRLITDSEGCSSESRFTLLELGLEECAKGMSILWRLDIRKLLRSREAALERWGGSRRYC
jgi:hypothetical protein